MLYSKNNFSQKFNVDVPYAKKQRKGEKSKEDNFSASNDFGDITVFKIFTFQIALMPQNSPLRLKSIMMAALQASSNWWFSHLSFYNLYTRFKKSPLDFKQRTHWRHLTPFLPGQRMHSEEIVIWGHNSWFWEASLLYNVLN